MRTCCAKSPNHNGRLPLPLAARMSVSPLLMRFVDDELARAPALAARTLAVTLQRFRDPPDESLGPLERERLETLGRAVQDQGALYQVAFLEALRTLSTAELDPRAAGRLPLMPNDPSGLFLLDETRVESDIEIARAIGLIDAVTASEQRELQSFTTTLRGQTHASAESNPLRPQTYARALWHAAAAMPSLSVLQQSMLLQTSATALAESLRTVWVRAAMRLSDQGVVAHVVAPPAPPAAAADADDAIGWRPIEVDVTQPGALDGLLSTMPSASDIAPLNAPRIRRAPSPALEEELRRFEAALRAVPTALPSDAIPRLSSHEAALTAAADDGSVDRQIIELMSRLFDTILGDPMLTPSLQPAAARLQASALRIALHDPFLLETHKHPVWALLDGLTAAGAAVPPGDGAQLKALQAFADALVDDMAGEPAQDTALYRRSLTRLEQFRADRLGALQRQHQSAIDALLDKEKIDQMRQQISARLVEQMVRVRTSPVVRRFVTGPWAHALAVAMRRFGERSERAVALMQTVDDLLWSLQLPDHPHSRQRLVTLIPGLLQRLRDGMALVGLPDAEQQLFLDELMASHTESLRGTGTAAGTASGPLSPQDIVQRMRDEVTAPATPAAHTFRDSLIDLGSMDTVPAEWLPTSAPGAEADPHDAVLALVPGQHQRIFLHGRWTLTQLLWRSPHGQLMLFASDAPGQTHSITQRALERLFAAKLVQPVNASPLIQRAVDGMLRGLASRP
jgi:hypothetical protein